MELTSETILERFKSATLEGIFLARAGLYLAESYPLVLLDQWIQHRTLQLPQDGLSERELYKEVSQLIHNDVDNITKGIYPLSAIRIENPVTHVKNLFRVYKDSVLVSKKKKEKKTKVFSKEAAAKVKSMPDYYRRNFHFQTDGYMSQTSAEIYDHQVDILFRGTADAMRRLILKPMVETLGSKRRLQILEVGCGTGISTMPLAQTFFQSRIKGVDLSEDYISFCRKQYKQLNKVSFDVAAGEDLSNIKSNSQDAWCSTYMFHELPKNIRVQVIQEAHRVLKPGGWIFITDSVQKHDRPDLKALLDSFPQRFHEPFYKNYSITPMENLLAEQGFENIKSENYFVTKTCWAQKPG